MCESNDFSKWRSKIDDLAFDKIIKIQHRHKYGEEWLGDSEELRDFCSSEEISEINQKYPVRYSRSASDPEITEWISGPPVIFSPVVAVENDPVDAQIDANNTDDCHILQNQLSDVNNITNPRGLGEFS